MPLQWAISQTTEAFITFSVCLESGGIRAITFKMSSMIEIDRNHTIN